jgi:hypothetical protein
MRKTYWNKVIDHLEILVQQCGIRHLQGSQDLTSQTLKRVAIRNPTRTVLLGYGGALAGNEKGTTSVMGSRQRYSVHCSVESMLPIAHLALRTLHCISKSVRCVLI